MCWAGATPSITFATEPCAKAPAQHGVLPASKLIVLSHVNSSPCSPCSIVKVNARVTDRVNCAFHAPVTLPRRKKRLRFVAIDTHLLLKRPRKRKNAKESFGPELQEPVGRVLMVESPPSPLYSLGNIEKGKRQKKIFVPVHFPDESAKE